jgi:hypothetical protein
MAKEIVIVDLVGKSRSKNRDLASCHIISGLDPNGVQYMNLKNMGVKIPMGQNPISSECFMYPAQFEQAKERARYYANANPNTQYGVCITMPQTRRRK